MNTSGPIAARRRYRECARRLRLQPASAPLHLERIDAALQLEGAEPLQGALVDLFAGLPADATVLRQTALRIAAPCLPARTREAFERLHAGTLPRVHPLATRWSVLVQPSAEVPARLRRSSADASRQLASRVTDALLQHAADARRTERAFLDHCMSCQDKLAFMLAARRLRAQGWQPDQDWREVETWLLARDAHGTVAMAPAPRASRPAVAGAAA